MVDWKSSIIVLIMASVFFQFFLRERNSNNLFEVNSNTLRYHSNWTIKVENLHHRKELQ